MTLRFRYSMWDGTQDVPEFTADDILESLTDDLMNFGDLEHALRNLMQRGMRNPTGDRRKGLRDLLQQLRQQRRQQLDRFDLSSVFDDLRRQLDEILDLEKKTLERRLAEADAAQQHQGDGGDGESQTDAANSEQTDTAHGERSMPGEAPGATPQSQGGGSPDQGESGERAGQPRGDGANESPVPSSEFADMLRNIAHRKQDFLSDLPEDVPSQIRQLQNYEFMDPEAQARFNELLESLKKAMMDTFFKDLSNQIQNMTPEDIERMKDMVRDLNEMIRDRMAGNEPNFDEFMEKYGDLFGDNPPQSLDELVAQMQQ